MQSLVRRLRQYTIILVLSVVLSASTGCAILNTAGKIVNTGINTAGKVVNTGVKAAGGVARTAGPAAAAL